MSRGYGRGIAYMKTAAGQVPGAREAGQGDQLHVLMGLRRAGLWSRVIKASRLHRIHPLLKLTRARAEVMSAHLSGADRIVPRLDVCCCQQIGLSLIAVGHKEGLSFAQIVTGIGAAILSMHIHTYMIAESAVFVQDKGVHRGHCSYHQSRLQGAGIKRIGTGSARHRLSGFPRSGGHVELTAEVQ